MGLGGSCERTCVAEAHCGQRGGLSALPRPYAMSPQTQVNTVPHVCAHEHTATHTRAWEHVQLESGLQAGPQEIFHGAGGQPWGCGQAGPVTSCCPPTPPPRPAAAPEISEVLEYEK